MPITGLWDLIKDRTRLALEAGALEPISTDHEVVVDRGVHFVVHILARIERKQRARTEQRRLGTNPFLAPDPTLTVAELSQTHLCVLNKFSVIDHHLLIITRRYEDQEELLTHQDFTALAECMAEVDGLGFYNAGEVAGASQAHKHLQLVPLPLGHGPYPTPMDRVLSTAAPMVTSMVDALPFPHAAIRLGGAPIRSDDAAELHRGYKALLEACGVDRPGLPYNLLLTREWMLVVPRVLECFEGISVNALGFAGSLLVRDREQLGLIREQGPMTVLRHAVTGT